MGQSVNCNNGKNPFKTGFSYSQKVTASQSICWKFNFNQWIIGKWLIKKTHKTY